MTPNAGYDFTGWSPALSATIPAPAETVAQYALKTYIITATAGPYGNIAPSRTVVVTHGTSQGFVMTADPGCVVLDVRVDGASVGAVNDYTFPAVTTNHTIAASFSTALTWVVQSPYGQSQPAVGTNIVWWGPL